MSYRVHSIFDAKQKTIQPPLLRPVISNQTTNQSISYRLMDLFTVVSKMSISVRQSI